MVDLTDICGDDAQVQSLLRKKGRALEKLQKIEEKAAPVRADLRDLELACQEGYARLQRLRDGSERHLVAIHGTEVVAVYLPKDFLVRQAAKNPSLTGLISDHGRIVTILPKAAALPGGGLTRTIKPSKFSKKGALSSKFRAWRKGEE